MTKQPDPVQVVSSLGLGATSSWHKLGQGNWSGQVTLGDETWEIQQLSTSWKAVGVNVSAKTLELLLKQLFKGRKKT